MQDGQVYKDIWYNEQMNNAKCVAKTDNAQLRTMGSGHGSVYYVNKGDYAILTGYYYNAAGQGSYIFAQTTIGLYAVINLDNSDFTLIENSAKLKVSAQETNKMISKLIENQEHIFQNNLFCARYAYKLTAEEKQQLYDLQQRLEQRNQALQNADYVESTTTSTPAGYSQLQPYLTQFMESGGIGIATETVIAIVVAVTLIASLSTAAYFAYKYYYEESEQDVKFSDNLTKVLMEKLTPEEYAQLKAETQGIVTKAKLSARLKSSVSWVAIAALAVGGFILLKKAKII